MNYHYKITWTQPYVGWHEWKMQELEQRLSYSDLAEAKSVIERIMDL